MQQDGRWSAIGALLLLLAVAACGRRPTSAAQPSVPTSTPTDDVLPASRLSAALSAPGKIEAGMPVPVTFTLTNNTDQTLYVLKWFTPLEGIANEIFIVHYDDRPLPYEGILAMRDDPTPEAYVRLAGGATTSATVDLAASYDVSRPGTYTITFLSPRISHVATNEAEMATTVDELGKVEIPCDPITVTVSTSAVDEVAAQPPTPVTPREATIRLEAVVGRASPSARIVSLETAVETISTIALVDSAEIVSAPYPQINNIST